MGQEEAAVEIRDVSKRDFSEARLALFGRLGETFEKEIAQEVAEEAVFPGVFGGG